MKPLLLATVVAESFIGLVMFRDRAFPLAWAGGPTLLALALGGAIGALFYGMLRRHARIRCVPRPGSPPSLPYLVFTATFEELAFRGYGLSVTAALFGVTAGIVMTTIAFALMHAQQGWFSVGFHVLTGLMFTFALFATHDLAAAVAAHITYNLFTSRTMLVRSRGPLMRISL